MPHHWRPYLLRDSIKKSSTHYEVMNPRGHRASRGRAESHRAGWCYCQPWEVAPPALPWPGQRDLAYYTISLIQFSMSFKCKFKTFFTQDVCLHKRTFYILNVLNFSLKISPSGRASPGFRHMSYYKNYFFPWEIIPDPSGISNFYCFF